MFTEKKTPIKPMPAMNPDNGKPVSITLLTVVGGFFNGNITKMNEGAERVLAIDEKRTGQQFATR